MFYVGAIAVAMLIVLAWWAARTALAGRPLFEDLAMEEKPATTQAGRAVERALAHRIAFR